MDATKLIEEVTGLIGKLPALPWQQAPKQCGHTRCDCPLMQNYVRDAQDRTVFAVALEGSTDWKMRRLEGEIAAVLARLVSCVPELIAALKASEERARKAEELAAANLAANKRIVELEHERDAAKRQISALENQLVNAAALRIEDEAHCERLIAERDAARAELAHLTTPRPIAEAPKDGTWILALWTEPTWAPMVLRWEAGEWHREDRRDDEGYMPTHYLPLPEVKP